MSFILPLPLNFASCEIQDGGKKTRQNDPHGTNFLMGTKDILFTLTSAIKKMQIKMYHGGARDPYLPTRLCFLLYIWIYVIKYFAC